MNTCLRRWEFPCGETAGCELVAEPLAPDEVAAALRNALSHQTEGAFLLSRLAPTDCVGVCEAMHGAENLGSEIRVVLAIDLFTLERLDSRLPESATVGLMLDCVSERTPLSAFTLDSIEAIRFEPAFVAAASKSLRVDAALRAMLLLANDLALGTFAPASLPGHGPSGQPRFDYLTRDARFADRRSGTAVSAADGEVGAFARRN